jgi:streptogramin lyase
MLTRRRPSALRLLALAIASAAALAVLLGAMISAAQAAPVGKLTQFKVPTPNSAPRHITVGSDGNLWFTEGNDIFTPDPDDPDGGGPSTATSVGSPPRARSPSFA